MNTFYFAAGAAGAGAIGFGAGVAGASGLVAGTREPSINDELLLVAVYVSVREVIIKMMATPVVILVKKPPGPADPKRV